MRVICKASETLYDLAVSVFFSLTTPVYFTKFINKCIIIAKIGIHQNCEVINFTGCERQIFHSVTGIEYCTWRDWELRGEMRELKPGNF